MPRYRAVSSLRTEDMFLLPYIGMLFFFVSFAQGLEDQPNQEEIPD